MEIWVLTEPVNSASTVTRSAVVILQPRFNVALCGGLEDPGRGGDLRFGRLQNCILVGRLHSAEGLAVILARHDQPQAFDLLISAPGVLTHYDFWSGNTLWRDGTLTGVVDWSGAAVGPRGFDVGWCRLDLYLLYDQRIADCFLDAYQAASGNTLTGSLLWDLWAVARSCQDVESWVPNYHDLSRSDLTATELRTRHTQWSRYLLGQSTSTTF